MESDRKKPTQLAIRSGTMGDYDAIEQLCDERYGTGYVSRESVALWARCPELFLVAEKEGSFAGFSVMIPSTPQRVAEQLQMPLSDVLKTTGDKPPLNYKSGAVVLEYEHQGVISALAAQEIKQAKRMGFGAMFTSAWEYNGRVPVEGLLKRFAFERLYERKMLWYHMKDYECVVCKGRCQCSGVIYQNKL